MRSRSFAETLRRRTEWGFCIMAVCFLVLGLRLFQIQVLQHGFFKKQADRYHLRRISIEAARGALLDRNGDCFTQNLPLKSVYADPKLVDDPAGAAQKLAPVLDRPAATLEKALRRKCSFTWLKRKVDRKTENAVRALNLKGIDFLPETRRTYPLKCLAANLTGFTNIDGKGIEGLERQLDPIIAGKNGWVVAEVDALGRIIPGTTHERVEAVDGSNVVLTLDTRIQHLTEAALDKAFKTYQAAGASAVVMDPRSGAILAIASRPTYNPNDPGDSTFAQRRNRCVTDIYEPGSTFKAITAAAALQEHVITPYTTFYCGGSYAIGRRHIRCVVHEAHKKGHGYQNISGILRESCNIGTTQIAQRLGAKKLYRYIANFGFIGDTHAGLLGEQRGLLSPPDDWPMIKLANVSFGQGVAVTPLQVATAYCAIANGGKLMQPHFIQRIVDGSGKVTREYKPHVVRQVISPETTRLLTQCLKVVVDEGTGEPAKVEGYSVAGKTGSAQKASAGGRGYAAGRFTSSFVGYAPADNPRIVAIVIVDEPKGSHWGATTAAPAFQEIVRGALWYMKVPPDRAVNLQQLPKGE